MAGLAKPFWDTRKEAVVTQLGYFLREGTNISGLFDGTQVNEWNTNRVAYWSGAGVDYVEFETFTECNFWRSGTGGWPSYTGKLEIRKWDGTSFVVITDTYSIPCTPITHTQWEMFIKNLPQGRYRLYCTTIRIDSEWYVEESNGDFEGRATRSTLDEMKIGDRIPCAYTATANSVGYYSSLGSAKQDLIPVTSSASPSGRFHFIHVGFNHLGRMKLVADRNIQHSISWDVLNSVGLNSEIPVKIHEPTSNLFNHANRARVVYACDVSGNPIYRASTVDGGRVVDNGTSFWAHAGGYDPQGIVNNNDTLDVSRTAYNLVKAGSNATTGYRAYQPMSLILDYNVDKPVGETKTIEGIYIASAVADGDLGNFEVYYSTDADAKYNPNHLSWQLGCKSTAGADGFLTYTPFSSPVTFRYLLVKGWGKGGKSYIEIMALKAYEYVADSGKDNFYVRNLSGGVSATDKDNEWDKIIAEATLGDSTTPGDNNCWNWSGIASWTSTAHTTNTSRVIRGNVAVGTWNGVSSSTANATTGFRPVLLVESLFKPPVVQGLMLTESDYGLKLTLSATEITSESAKLDYRVLLVGTDLTEVEKVPLSGAFKDSPVDFTSVEFSRSEFGFGTSKVIIEVVDDSNPQNITRHELSFIRQPLTRYLIYAGSAVYTYNGSDFIDTSLNFDSLSDSDFLEHGVYDLGTVPFNELPHDKLRVLEWADESNNQVVKFNAVTPNQLVVANEDIPLGMVKSIDFFEVFGSMSGGGEVRLAVSINGGVTWLSADGSGNFFDLGVVIPLKSFSDLSVSEKVNADNATASISTQGITLTQLTTLDFNLLGASGIRFAYVIIRGNLTDVALVDSMRWQFDAYGNIKKVKDSEFDVVLHNDKIEVDSFVTTDVMLINIM